MSRLVPDNQEVLIKNRILNATKELLIDKWENGVVLIRGNTYFEDCAEN